MSRKIPDDYPLRPGVEDFTKIPERLLIGPMQGLVVTPGKALLSGHQTLELRLCPWCPRCHALTG